MSVTHRNWGGGGGKKRDEELMRCRAVVENLTLGEFGNKADEIWEGDRRLKVEFVNEKISPDKDCCWVTTADNVFWEPVPLA